MIDDPVLQLDVIVKRIDPLAESIELIGTETTIEQGFFEGFTLTLPVPPLFRMRNSL